MQLCVCWLCVGTTLAAVLLLCCSSGCNHACPEPWVFLHHFQGVLGNTGGVFLAERQEKRSKIQCTVKKGFSATQQKSTVFIGPDNQSAHPLSAQTSTPWQHENNSCHALDRQRSCIATWMPVCVPSIRASYAKITLVSACTAAARPDGARLANTHHSRDRAPCPLCD